MGCAQGNGPERWLVHSCVGGHGGPIYFASSSTVERWIVVPKTRVQLPPSNCLLVCKTVIKITWKSFSINGNAQGLTRNNPSAMQVQLLQRLLRWSRYFYSCTLYEDQCGSLGSRPSMPRATPNGRLSAEVELRLPCSSTRVVSFR